VRACARARVKMYMNMGEIFDFASIGTRWVVKIFWGHYLNKILTILKY